MKCGRNTGSKEVDVKLWLSGANPQSGVQPHSHTESALDWNSDIFGVLVYFILLRYFSLEFTAITLDSNQMRMATYNSLVADRDGPSLIDRSSTVKWRVAPPGITCKKLLCKNGIKAKAKLKDLTFGTPRSPYPISGGTKRVLVSPLLNVHMHQWMIHDGWWEGG